MRATGHFMRRRWRLLLFALVCLIGPLWGFAELADEVRDRAPFEFDEPFLRSARAMSSAQMDFWMLLASDLGYKGGVMPFDIMLLVALLALKHVRHALFFGLAVGGSALISMGTKLLFRRDRPALWESISPEHTFSFPSGHAMGSMTLAAAAVMLTWHTRWRWPMVLAGLAFAFWVAMSRVYLGVHYPSDILAGWVVAIFWTTIVYLSVRPHRHTEEVPDARSVEPEAPTLDPPPRAPGPGPGDEGR